MSELLSVLGVGGSVAVVGGSAAYARHRHPDMYWSTVGLPLSAGRLLGSYGSVMGRVRPDRGRTSPMVVQLVGVGSGVSRPSALPIAGLAAITIIWPGWRPLVSASRLVKPVGAPLGSPPDPTVAVLRCCMARESPVP